MNDGEATRQVKGMAGGAKGYTAATAEAGTPSRDVVTGQGEREGRLVVGD
jgi:hypothetical protein